jgi:hypothetical protein
VILEGEMVLDATSPVTQSDLGFGFLPVKAGSTAPSPPLDQEVTFLYNYDRQTYLSRRSATRAPIAASARTGIPIE